MLGLRPEIDARTHHLVASKSNSNSSKFVSRFHNHFPNHVIGVTTSLQKHSRMLALANKNANKEDGKSLSIDQSTSLPLSLSLNDRPNRLINDYTRLSEKQRYDIEKDKLRLQEIQLKLKNIQQQKKLRYQRDIIRNIRKQQYKAVCLIQFTFRNWIQNKRNIQIEIIKFVLKSLQVKQSISAMSWSCKVIRRFAIRVSCY